MEIETWEYEIFDVYIELRNWGLVKELHLVVSDLSIGQEDSWHTRLCMRAQLLAEYWGLA